MLGFENSYTLSNKIQNWIINFDKGRQVEPFEFKIENNLIKMKGEVI